MFPHLAGVRERLVRRFAEFTNEYPWRWTPSHVDEWSQSPTGERHLAPSTIRAYQGSLRLFNEFLCDSRYGWALACEASFGPDEYPVANVHEWNSLAHLQSYEGDPDDRPFTRDELQRFLDYATTKSTARFARNATAHWQPIETRPCSK